MHVQTDLLHCVGDIRTRQCDILKSAGETPVLGSISKKVTIRTRELNLSVNRGRHRMAVRHASSLREEESIDVPCHSNAQKEVKWSKICHGELPMKLIKQTLKKLSRRRSQNNIVHVEQEIGRINS
jgi:hypothetical protein